MTLHYNYHNPSDIDTYIKAALTDYEETLMHEILKA